MLTKHMGTTQLRFSLCFGAGWSQGRQDTYTLPLSLALSFKGGRMMLWSMSLHTAGTDREFGGCDEWKKEVSLTYFSNIATRPLANSREELKFCASAGGKKFGRNKNFFQKLLGTFPREFMRRMPQEYVSVKREESKNELIQILVPRRCEYREWSDDHRL